MYFSVELGGGSESGVPPEAGKLRFEFEIGFVLGSFFCSRMGEKGVGCFAGIGGVGREAVGL